MTQQPLCVSAIVAVATLFKQKTIPIWVFASGDFRVVKSRRVPRRNNVKRIVCTIATYVECQMQCVQMFRIHTQDLIALLMQYLASMQSEQLVTAILVIQHLSELFNMFCGSKTRCMHSNGVVTDVQYLLEPFNIMSSC
ncbi:Hypothetical_protein [Hexamita inflata]|uniref:Hypothetical_protein n=1 Tax=Hexamita inflata TaxID=28002 RepID=A0AA86Q2A9_9EUKA|nr:Hypothetical protein HINF_LOCUS9466 [Hexamita inflata]CAI9945032.1 Hypothetical protein HINF_LOCUS32677 [Hexamita inflata]CAI9953503.1 Hypothetical protein HINF_LOCUS41148 [Hexamita inflata]CAI9953508.1 Hypothetical protein HINF_LOCUS41153 [Hexamita inflata]